MLAAGAIAAAAAWVVTEALSRWWIRRRTGYYVWPPGMRVELHPDAAVFPGVERRVRFAVNADGERGADVRADEPGLFRVLLAGGSPAECFALDQPTSWGGALERLLNSPDSLRRLGARRAHVGSIGRGGISSEHLDLIFQKALPRYRRLDAIVIMVGGNDVFLWLEDGAPSPLPSGSVRVATTFGCHPEERFGWRPGQWAMTDVVRRWRRAHLRPLDVREDGLRWVVNARRMRAEAKELRTELPDPRPMLERFERHLRRLLETARAHAGRVVMVRQPWFETDYAPEEDACLWHGGLGKAWKERITVYYAQPVLNRLMQMVDAAAAGVAHDMGIDHIDVRGVLRPSLAHYYDYVHYTPAGAAIVARATADALVRTGRPTVRTRSAGRRGAKVGRAVAPRS